MARAKTGTYHREWWVAMDLEVGIPRSRRAKILGDCGHQHRTMEAADECTRKHGLVGHGGYRYVACKVSITESCLPWGEPLIPGADGGKEADRG